MKKILLLFLGITLFQCSSDDSDSNDDTTCPNPSNVTISGITDNSASLTWTSVEDNTSFDIEYGQSGFTQGSGTLASISANQYTIANLTEGTNYQVYVRAKCNTDSSDWTGPFSFATLDIECPEAIGLDAFSINDDNISIGLQWSFSGSGDDIQFWEVEYGETGFILGQGQTETINDTFIELSNLQPSTMYDFYVRAKCTSDNYSAYTGPVSITTVAACSAPNSVSVSGIQACSFIINWGTSGETAWEIEYGESGFTLGSGTVINTSNSGFIIEDDILPNTTYEVYLRANCGSDGFSEYTDALVITTNSINLGELSNKYVGSYQYQSVIDGEFGPVFGEPETVTLIETESNVRIMNVIYYEAFTSTSIDFEFTLSLDGELLVSPSQETPLSCGVANIELGPISSVQPYEVCDDSALEFSFVEYYQGSGDCGGSDNEVRIRLIKL